MIPWQILVSNDILITGILPKIFGKNVFYSQFVLINNQAESHRRQLSLATPVVTPAAADPPQGQAAAGDSALLGDTLCLALPFVLLNKLSLRSQIQVVFDDGDKCCKMTDASQKRLLAAEINTHFRELNNSQCLRVFSAASASRHQLKRNPENYS